MHRAISANQIRAARVYLDWSQDQLAESADLGKSTIRNLEAGFISLHSAAKVRKVFEANGIEFTEGDGIRRRADSVRMLKSPDGCSAFFDDMLETAREKHGDILIVTRNESTLFRSCGLAGADNLHQLNLLNDAATIKCLCLEVALPTLSLPSFEFRITPQNLSLSEKIYCLYGDKLALISSNGPKNDFNFVIIDAPGFVDLWRAEFLDLWALSFSPVNLQKTLQLAKDNSAG